jgi:RND family efflux transporter MFP subunit
MRQRHRQIKTIIAIVFFIATLVLVAACNRPTKEEAPKTVIPVQTGKVNTQSFSIPVGTSGRLFPADMAKLSFKTGGIVSRVPVSEGQQVTAGTLLASLDTKEIDANVTQAREGLKKSKRDLQRVTNLYRDKAATLEQLQDVTTAAKIAKARLDIALFNKRHSQVKAPANGVVLKVLAEENETIGPGYPVILFGSLDTRWVVKVGVTESQLIHLSDGDRATIRFDAYPQTIWNASVTEIARTIDSASQTYEVELELEPRQETLAAGFVARVRIFPSQQKTFRWVPLSAMVEGEGNIAAVFTVNGNKAQKVKIRIAHILDGKVLAASGLETIDTVVTEGAAYLTDGALVRIAPPAEK